MDNTPDKVHLGMKEGQQLIINLIKDFAGMEECYEWILYMKRAVNLIKYLVGLEEVWELIIYQIKYIVGMEECYEWII